MMQFIIDGEMRDFMPIKEFRAAYGLPPEFSVARFEPKDYAGLGSIERAGTELNAVRRTVLDALPERVPFAELLNLLSDLTRVFEQQLYAINAQVSLKDAEIGFAVSGFDDVCRHWGYGAVRSRVEKKALPDFASIYDDWLNNSIRVSQTRHLYRHDGQSWAVQVMTHAYGRFGLMIHTGDATHYVYDAALACPAEGYMHALLSDVVNLLVNSLQ
jgi:hypothetical protein